MLKEYEAPPNILYHYTSVEAFRNIIESGKIRATRYDQMNDISEVQLGVNNLLNAVKSHETSFRDYRDFLISAIEGYKEDTLEVYILSLSSAADSLYQWRAYAPNGGVSIGFDRKMVQKGFLIDITPKVGGQQVENPIRPDPANRLMQCQYTDKNECLDLSSEVAERFFKPNSFSELYASGQSDDKKFFFFCLSLSAMIYRTICSIKHVAYHSEEEWRSVNYRPDSNFYPIKLSEKNRWYIEMEFDPKKFIKEVWIFPDGYRKASESIVAYFKRKNDLSFAIENSKIPFRG